VRRVLLVLLGLLLAIQLVPVSRTNTPGTIDAVAAPAEVTALLRRACADCHTGSTVWPWYSRVAPVSWLVAHDVDEGREHLDLTALAALAPRKRAKAFDEIAEEVEERAMPPRLYRWLHPGARLDEAERRTLIDWAVRAESAVLAEAPPLEAP
jgi:hypothetical protein